jgi:cytochrome c556
LPTPWNNQTNRGVNPIANYHNGETYMKIKTKIVAALTLAAVTGAAFAQQALKPEEMIKFRQSAYGFMAWNMSKIKAQLDAPSFNKEEAAKAAHAVAVVANSGMSVLYQPGTDKGTGWKETRLKSEFFQQQEEVKKLATAFNQAANELDKVAQTGDKAALQAQFGKTGETCKSCHDKFRKD